MGYLSPFCKLELQNVLVHLDLFKNTFSILTFAINVRDVRKKVEGRVST